MKIGIVTITELENLGNRLQNYALQETLKSLGAEVETIRNYITYKHRKSKKWQTLRFLEGIRNRSRSAVSEVIKIKRFEWFDKKHFAFSKFYSEIDYIPENLGQAYDYFIAGSDQIWNPIFPFNLDFNFLTFCQPHQRIAYSGSFGVDEIPSEKEEQFIDYINSVPSLSVREYSGQRIIKRLTGKDAQVLIDPSLLLNSEQWRALSKKPKRIVPPKKYILVYYLGGTQSLETILEDVKKENPALSDCEIVDIHDRRKIWEYAITPDEFIWLIDHAELVITDSFHGTVFSVLMETPFVHSLRSGGVNMNSRVYSLFRKLGLEFHDGIFQEHIDNPALNAVLTKCRNESLTFLCERLYSDHEA